MAMKNSIKLLDDRFLYLYQSVVESGIKAKEEQKNIHRSLKEDGSPVTEIDISISHYLVSKVKELFPGEWIISEEEEVKNGDNYSMIFAIDPIDGTDVFSMGLPSFAVSIGVLSKELEPIGAIISCPRFGLGEDNLNILMEPNGKIYVNEKEFVYKEKDRSNSQIAVGSKSFKSLDFSSFDGKVRVFGSTIIHLLLPSLLPPFIASITENCYVWDILSSHAILKRIGMDLEYINGDEFKYTEDFVFKKNKLPLPVIGGLKEDRKAVISALQSSSSRNF